MGKEYKLEIWNGESFDSRKEEFILEADNSKGAGIISMTEQITEILKMFPNNHAWRITPQTDLPKQTPPAEIYSWEGQDG